MGWFGSARTRNRFHPGEMGKLNLAVVHPRNRYNRQTRPDRMTRLAVWPGRCVLFEAGDTIPSEFAPSVSPLENIPESSPMVVSASKVSSFCSSSEIALVMASRPPELNRLTSSQLKQLIARARKLCDKSQDKGRKQARTKSRLIGSGSTAIRTLLKTEIFAAALRSFESRLAKLAEAPETSADKPRRKSKRARTAAHRSTRAQVRKSLARQQTNH